MAKNQNDKSNDKNEKKENLLPLSSSSPTSSYQTNQQQQSTTPLLLNDQYYTTMTVEDKTTYRHESTKNGPDDINISNLNVNMIPPSYQKVERISVKDVDGNYDNIIIGDNNNNNKTCRICLEEDLSETMIAPCQCKGTSKWVHRDCLNEWRIHEHDRAFAKCTECQFEYYMQPIYYVEDNDSIGNDNIRNQQRRRFTFHWKVSRDICVGTIVLQFVIIAFTIFIAICDPNNALPNQYIPYFQTHPISLYYILGWLLLLVLIGLYGSIVLCMNKCSIQRSIPQLEPPSHSNDSNINTIINPSRNNTIEPYYSIGTKNTTTTMENDIARGIGVESTTEYYRRIRRRRQNYNERRHNRHRHPCCQQCLDNPCDCCWYGYYGWYDCQPCCVIYDSENHGCCCCCNCCCCDDGTARGAANAHHCANNNDDCFCDCGGGGGGNNSNDCGDGIHILLVILLVGAIILAIIGFFVGIVISVIAFQRVIQRHIHLVQKRQLVKEYQVMDLQNYDLDRPVPTAPCEEDVEIGLAASAPIPSAPIEPLPAKDVSYLQKLGLMDRNN